MIKRNAISLFFALLFISLFLRIELTANLDQIQFERKLMVDFSKEKVIEQIKQEPLIKPKALSQPSKDKIKTLKKDLQITKKTPSLLIKKPPIGPSTVETPKLPSSGVILDSFYSGLSKSQKVPKDFQKSFKENDDFIYFEVEDPDWNKIVKLIDEEMDKPRVKMKFYSNGVRGKFERMIDKITYTKTFTTKYGTKITCGVVGVLAACSWK